MNLVKKSILTAILCLIIYNITLYFIEGSLLIYPQNINQDNKIKTEEYIYNDRIPKKVIVGSSLAAKLDKKLLNGNFYNLAFRGKSAYDGFKIISEKEKLPEIILIEYNAILRGPYPEEEQIEFIKKSESFIKENVPSQRSKNQPVNIVISVAYSFLEYLKGDRDNSSSQETLNSSTETQTNESNNTSENMEDIIQEAVNDYKEVPSDSLIEKRLSLLKEYVRDFKSKGVRIIFFKMPVDCELSSLEWPKAIQEAMYEYFSQKKYHYIDVPPCENYYTKDGIHLVDKSAKAYTTYLLDKISVLDH